MITHPLQQVDSLTRHGHRVERLIFQDCIEDFILVISPERRLTEQHLVRQDTKRPPVDSTSVPLLEQDLKDGRKSAIVVIAHSDAVTYLGSHELGRSTECAGGLTEPHVLLTKTVIGDFDVTVEGEKNVVQLQITAEVV